MAQYKILEFRLNVLRRANVFDDRLDGQEIIMTRSVEHSTVLGEMQLNS